MQRKRHRAGGDGGQGRGISPDSHVHRDLRYPSRAQATNEPHEVLERVDRMVRFAKSFTTDIEFSAEDATRSDWEFLAQVFATAINAGATTINVPDTVGYTSPLEYAALMEYLTAKVPEVERAIISVHCHDDLGMATANTLAAVRAGARQVEVTMNGIGERAGNTSLEEVVMALATRGDQFGRARHASVRSG